MLSIFGLLLLCSAGVFANYNLYLNEHETMRLLGESSIKFYQSKHLGVLVHENNIEDI